MPVGAKFTKVKQLCQDHTSNECGGDIQTQVTLIHFGAMAHVLSSRSTVASSIYHRTELRATAPSSLSGPHLELLSFQKQLPICLRGWWIKVYLGCIWIVRSIKSLKARPCVNDGHLRKAGAEVTESLKWKQRVKTFSFLMSQSGPTYGQFQF